MKPQVLNISMDALHSFGARIDSSPDVNNRWHCHAALELIYFKNGSGTQFIGDSIKSFKSGDVVLLGQNLPHYWRFTPRYFGQTGATSPEIYVIHFTENFWGKEFLNLPEFQEIKKIIELAERGLQILGPKKSSISTLISKIVHASGPKRLSLLIDCLCEISHCKEIKYLVTPGFQVTLPDIEKERLQTIYNYTLRNYKKKIDLRAVAEIAGMSPTSFCRFFKNTSNKTYGQFLSEVRVGQACKLLIENKLSVKQICYTSGFFNIASFHRTFRNFTGKTPLVYQKAYY